MISTTSKNKKRKLSLWSIIIWVGIWQLAAMCLNSDILLASPVKVVKALAGLVCEASFWRSVAFSSLRITAGFCLAMIFGIVLGALSYRFSIIEKILRLPVAAIKATPVVSFIILVLVWVPSKNLSIVISFLIAFPVMYTNIIEGLLEMDSKMLSMSKVFRIPFSKRVRYIYIPQVIPYFRAACALALGLCWKSGIAAEIIGLPMGTIGERLYQAKIYLNMPEMFAWTVVIIAVSILFEKIVMKLIVFCMNKLEGK